MRLVCLSAESADICARLGAWEEVVAVSAYAAQPGLEPRPVVSGFSTGDAARIAGHRPDLVITFSDVQADLAAQLIRLGVTVLATNQRTLAEIEATIRLIGGAIDRAAAGAELAAQFSRDLAGLKADVTPRPRVYFEEWPDPLISGIAWAGEIIELCGGVDVFAERRGRAARERTVGSAEVVAANPDVILASWCGKRADFASLRARPGFERLAAVAHGALHEIDSADILQPGPRLIAGAREIRRVLDDWRAAHSEAPPARLGSRGEA